MRLTGMPSIRASRAPARPASARATALIASSRNGLKRARGEVSPGIYSANVTVVHSGFRHKNRRIAVG